MPPFLPTDEPSFVACVVCAHRGPSDDVTLKALGWKVAWARIFGLPRTPAGDERHLVSRTVWLCPECDP